MKDYTLGFMFSEDSSKVLLILKDRPEWQRDKLNGIGGKAEPKDELNLKVTQIREFKEKTGIGSSTEDWELFCIINGTETESKTGTEIGSQYRIWCYKAFSDNIYNAKRMETEQPEIIHVNNINKAHVLPNVNWLIPMALYTNKQVLEIKYN